MPVSAEKCPWRCLASRYVDLVGQFAIIRLMSFANRLIERVETFPITQGESSYSEQGKFKCLPWQRRFLRGVFRPHISTAALSVGRGNGKSTLCALIACAFLTDKAKYNSDLVIVASSFEQAQIIFRAIIRTLYATYTDESLRKNFRKIDSTNNASIQNRITGLRVKVIGNDADKAHGLQAFIVLADEPAKWPTGGLKMWNALKTSQGKIANSKLIFFGTQPESDNHFFSKLLRDDRESNYSQLHSVPKDCETIYQKKTWIRANPSLPYFPVLEKAIRDEAIDSKRDVPAQYQFRALRLNQGTSELDNQNFLVTLDDWIAIETDEIIERKGHLTVGLDLSGGDALSAAVGYWNLSGCLECFALFPSIPDLRERGIKDSVGTLYQELYDNGELITCYGRAVDIDLLLIEVRKRFGIPKIIVADRYDKNALFDALNRTGFSPDRTKLILTGLGWASAGPAVKETRRAIMKREVKVNKSLLFRMALAEARLKADDAGNWKLAKNSDNGRRLRGRDDPILAATLAIHNGIELLRKTQYQSPPRIGSTNEIV